MDVVSGAFHGRRLIRRDTAPGKRQLIAVVSGETIDVVLACDDAYAQHAHVVIASMLASNSQHNFRAFLLVPAGFRHAQRLRELERYANCQLHVIEIDADRVRDLTVSEHISTTAYFRLLVGDVLPADVRRVIYFDSDIVVTGDLLGLWQVDLGQKIVGAVADATGDRDAELKGRLGMPREATYFNSGVMVIDLPRWRAHDIAARTLQFCREHAGRLTYWDQCALNVVLAGNVANVNVIWNVQSSHFSEPDHRDVTGDAVSRARVVHFTTAHKPWLYLCSHPLAGLYWKRLRDTPWRGYRPPDRTVGNVVKRQLRRLLAASSAGLAGTPRDRA